MTLPELDRADGAALATPNLHTPELFAEAYHGRTADFYASLLAGVIRHGTPGQLVDLGAGLGLFAELADRWGMDVVALEGSAYAVAEAARRAPKLRMLVHDLGDPLPFPDESVSNVMLNQVIEHLDPSRCRRVLKECFRIMRPRGTIFVNSPSRRNLHERKEPTHVNMLLPSELDAELELTGFRVISRPNYGLWFAHGESRIAGLVADVMLRFLPADWISSSANAIARK